VSAGRLCLFFLIAFALRGQESTSLAQDIRAGQILQSHGRFLEAERQLEAVVKAAESTGASADLQVTALSNLASIQIELVRLEEAASTCEKALRIMQKDSIRNAARIRTLQAQLAELYLEAGHAAIAEKLLTHALNADFPISENPDVGTAYAFDVLASAYSTRKNFTAAEEAVRKSLYILRAVNNPEPAAVAIGTLHLSSILNLRNRPNDALPYAQQALEMFSALALPQPGMRAAAEINLASIYSRLHLLDEARLTSQTAADRAEQFYGTQHPHTARILLAQAAVLRAIGQKQAAKLAQTKGEQILAGRATHLDNTVPVNALLPKMTSW
jgi:tetratricopeptide (TPR) repeat protein